VDHFRSSFQKDRSHLNIVAIIPAYNEGQGISKVILDCIPYVSKVIVIDDGSHDNTSHFAEETGAIVIRHPHNLGKGAACRSGFYGAMNLGCDAIIMLDGDGQHDPHEIPKFVTALKNSPLETGIVVGNRMNNTQDMPLPRYLTNTFLSFLISFLAGTKIKDSQCGYRLIHRRVLEAVDYENNRYDAESEILVRASRAGFSISEVPVRTIYRDEISKINVFWDTARFFRFFFRHLFKSPPIVESPARDISISLGQALSMESHEKPRS
jgi:glycosyltransferase involved in cell wall biosynthesis